MSNSNEESTTTSDPAVENASESESEYSDSDYDSDDYVPGGTTTTTAGENAMPAEDDNSREANIKRIKALMKIAEEEWESEGDEDDVFDSDAFDFPKDKEKWTEEDLQELWADAPQKMTKPGWDPYWADEEDWKIVEEEKKAGKEPVVAPFYVPYRKYYPVIPDDVYDIKNARQVVEELDRIEEFLKWVSYVFQDGSSYEGTVWDDLAHGKGVLVAEQGMVRYEGEWLQNNMEGHGVVEVEIPQDQPVPGSELEEQMRAEGKIINRDYMNPEDREWLEMDIEDSVRFANGTYEVPFYENEEWVKVFGSNPEKGRYRYAGQWKHGRMHGCGVYYVNEHPTYGRFYFGELLDDSTGCDDEIATMHGALAEVAAAKARMFMNKPDGMVREERGPYNDPQHPYFYEEEDVWQAPGFINQFYEVPDLWKTYVSDLDTERQMWLNSFYKAPLRLPMPAELEYWWEKDQTPEFVLINKEPEPDPNDPTKLVYTEDPLILHTKTGRLINYVDDPEYGFRMFWQPELKEGETVENYDPKKVRWLPLGYDDFYGEKVEEAPPTPWEHFLIKMRKICEPYLDKLDKWTEEKKKESEMKIKLLQQEMELAEAELELKEALEEMAEDLKREEEEAEMIAEEEAVEEEKDEKKVAPSTADQGGKPIVVEVEEVEEEEEADDDDDDDEDDGEADTKSSFGSTTDVGDNENKKGNRTGRSPFSTASMVFAPATAVPKVPSPVPKLQQLSACWNSEQTSHPCTEVAVTAPHYVSYPRVPTRNVRLKASIHSQPIMPASRHSRSRQSQLHILSRLLYSNQHC